MHLAPTRQPAYIKALLLPVSVLLAGLVVVYLWLMLQWPMMREGHYLHYIAYLINEHHFAPYRDIFETSWFGTFLFHMLVGKVFGYTAIAFRTADIVLLALLLTITWRIMRRLDVWLAWISTLTFALAYLHMGPANTLQRDYIVLLPISAAVLLALQPVHTRWRAFGIGILFGLATTVKPHTVIGMPVVLALLRSQSAAGQNAFWKIVLFSGAGGCLVFACGLGWLWHRDGLAAFLDMTFHYLPLYQSFNGAHHIMAPGQQWQETLKWWKYFLWLWPWTITLGLWRGWRHTTRCTEQRALVWSLAALALCYNLYPLPAGKFWDYHWIPYTYFAVLASALLLLPSQTVSHRQTAFTTASVLLFFYIAHSLYLPWRGLQEQLQRYPDIRVSTAYDDEVATFIRQHTPAGSTVQTIDQGGSSSQWLLKAESVLATPYLGSFVFLHHLDNPHILAAQQQFLTMLNQKPPALMIVMSDFTRPFGPNTRKDIPGFNEFLQAHYHRIRQTEAYAIWGKTGVVSAAAGELSAPAPAPHSAPANPP